MLKKIISIRVDVDTSVGLKRGVPRLLNLFGVHGIKASFFVVMGPDTMGRHVFRIKKHGYLKRILKINLVKLIKTYGIRPFFYGTLLKSPLIGESNAEALKKIVAQGHELGIHGYNHCYWTENHDALCDEEVSAELVRAVEAFSRALSKKPSASASPNWLANERLFQAEDECDLKYASDSRGQHPYRPLVEGRAFRTLQIPVTLRSTHECVQSGVNRRDVVATIMADLTDGINVWTIHDWYEGLCQLQFVEEFIRTAERRGYTFMRMDEIADVCSKDPNGIPFCNVKNVHVLGGVGEVTCQIA